MELDFARTGPLPARAIVELVLPALGAVAEAHAVGKLLDFGIAKATMGSPAYMAPEQLRSARLASPASDIWALGVVIYELAAGWPPFVGETISELAFKAALEPAPPLPGPARFADVVYRCLEKDPARRHRNVGELALALAPFGPPNAGEIAASVARVLAQPQPPERQRKTSMRLALGLALAIVVGVATRAVADHDAGAETAFQRGRTLFNEGKYGEACAAFEHSEKLDPQLGTQFDLAQCWEKLGKLASAWAAFRDIAQRDTNKTRRDQASTRAAALEPKLSKVHLHATAVPGFAVTSNGDDVTKLLDLDTPVDPGTYRLVASAAGYKTWSAQIEITEPGKTVAIDVPALDKIVHAAPVAPVRSTDPVLRVDPPRSSTAHTAIAIGLAGTSVIALGTGIALAVQATDRRHDAAALCPDPAMPCADATTANALSSSARTRAIGADVAFAAAGVSAIAAGIVWGTRSSVVVAPTVAPDRMAITAVLPW